MPAQGTGNSICFPSQNLSHIPLLGDGKRRVIIPPLKEAWRVNPQTSIGTDKPHMSPVLLYLLWIPMTGTQGLD